MLVKNLIEALQLLIKCNLAMEECRLIVSAKDNDEILDLDVVGLMSEEEKRDQLKLVLSREVHVDDEPCFF